MKLKAIAAGSTGITFGSTITGSIATSSTNGGRAKQTTTVLPTATALGTGTTASSSGSHGAASMSAATGTGTLRKTTITGSLVTNGLKGAMTSIGRR